MARSVTEFISNFDGGAKPNLYEVTIYTGNVPQVQEGIFASKQKPSLVFQAKGAQLPESAVGEIIVPYLGRQIKVPGDRVYQDWTITVLSDESMLIRKEFDKWNAILNGHSNNTPSGDLYSWTMQTTAIVKQLNRIGKTTHSYKLWGVFPKEVAAIDLAYDNNDTAMEFTVTLGYSYHEPGIQYTTTVSNP